MKYIDFSLGAESWMYIRKLWLKVNCKCGELSAKQAGLGFDNFCKSFLSF